MTKTPATLEALRARIARLECFFPPALDMGASGLLPFGVREIDAHLPEGGLSRAALHEISGESEAGPAVAALFATGLLARIQGSILWCATTGDIFAPGLAGAGLHPDRVLYARAPDEKTVLLLMEEALRHRGLGAVLGELRHLPMTASRRLVLAAEKSGVMAVALRPVPQPDEPNAAATRWCITPLPASPIPTPGIGRARWRVDLTRCRGGSAKTWIMEACDAQGVMSVPADLAYRQAAPLRRRA